MAGEGPKLEAEISLKLSEGSVETISGQIQDGLANVAGTIGEDGQEAPPPAAKTRTRGRGQTTANVALDTPKDVQKAGTNDEYKITINAKDVRTQIETALKEAFDVIVNADIRGLPAAEQGSRETSHSPLIERGAPASRGAPVPARVNELFDQGNSHIRGAIDAVYRNVSKASELAGQGSLKLAVANGNQAEKAIELMDMFGDKFDDWIKLSKRDIPGGSISMPTGAGGVGLDTLRSTYRPKSKLSVKEQEELEGAIVAANSGAMALLSERDSPRSANSAFVGLRKYATDNPLEAQPAAASERAADVQPEVPRENLNAEEVERRRTAQARSITDAEELYRAQRTTRAQAEAGLTIEPIGFNNPDGSPMYPTPALGTVPKTRAGKQPGWQPDRDVFTGDVIPSATRDELSEFGQLISQWKDSSSPGASEDPDPWMELSANLRRGSDSTDSRAELRDKFVDAIKQVKDNPTGEPPLHPVTGKPLTGLTAEHILKSLRAEMNSDATYDSLAQDPGRREDIVGQAFIGRYRQSEIPGAIEDAVESGFRRDDLVQGSIASEEPRSREAIASRLDELAPKVINADTRRSSKAPGPHIGEGDGKVVDVSGRSLSGPRRPLRSSSSTYIGEGGGKVVEVRNPEGSFDVREGVRTPSLTADEAARNSGMASDWMIDRDRRGLGKVITFGRKQVPMEPILQAAESGRYEDAFWEKTVTEEEGRSPGLYEKGKNKGKPKPGKPVKVPHHRLVKLSGDTPEEFKVLRDLRNAVPKMREMEGKEGEFQRVSASEAVIQDVLNKFGLGSFEEQDNPSVAAIRAQLEDTSTMRDIRVATNRGRAPLTAQRGVGTAGVAEGSSDKGARGTFIVDYIDKLEREIARISGPHLDVVRGPGGDGHRGEALRDAQGMPAVTMQPGYIDALRDRIDATVTDASGVTKFKETPQKRDKMRAQIREHASKKKDLEAQLAVARDERSSLIDTPDAESAKQLQAAMVRRGAIKVDSKALVQSAQDEYDPYSDTAQGRRVKTRVQAGAVVDPYKILAAARKTYAETSDRPDAQSGYRTQKQIAYGPGGNPINLPKRTDPTYSRKLEGGGLYTELQSTLDPSAPRSAKSENMQMFRDILDGWMKGNFDRVLNAGEDVARREPMTGASPYSRTRTVSSSVQNEKLAGMDDFFDQLTGMWSPPKPPQIASFEASVNGEGQYTGFASGAEGKIQARLDRNRRIRDNLEPMPSKDVDPEFRYFDPDAPDPALGYGEGAGGSTRGRVDPVTGLAQPRDTSSLPGSSFEQLTPQQQFDQSKAKFGLMAVAAEKARRARAETLANPKLVSGDESADIYRAAGVEMGPPRRFSAVEAFEDKYADDSRPWAGYESAGGAGGGASGGGATGGGAGGISGRIQVDVMNWPAALLAGAAGAGGSGEPPSADVAAPAEDEQPEEPKPPRVNKGGKRRKNLNARDVGTEANLDRIYAFEPGEDPDEDPARGRARDAMFTAQSARDARTNAAEDRLRMPLGDRSRKRMATGDTGTSVSPNGVYSFEPGQDPDEDPSRLRSRERLYSATLTSQDQQEALGTKQVRSLVSSEASRVLQETRKASPTAKRGLIGMPSRGSVEEGLGRLGVDVSLEDAPGVANRLTGLPDERIMKARAAKLRAARSLPQRALSTSFVQLAQNKLGGVEGPQRRLMELGNRTADVETLGNQYQSLQAQRAQNKGERATLREGIRVAQAMPGVKADDPDIARAKKRMEALSEEHMRLTKSTRAVSKAFDEGVVDVEKLAKSAVTTSDIVRNLGTGFIGGIAGGLVTGVLSQVVGSTTEVTTRLLDRAMGQINEVSAGGKALGSATQAVSGRSDIAVAQLATSTGMSDAAYAQTGAGLSEAAQVEAGNNAIDAQLKAARLYFRGQELGTGAGVSQGLGGAYGLPFGATAPMQEQFGTFLNERVPASFGRNLEREQERANSPFANQDGTRGGIAGQISEFFDPGSTTPKEEARTPEQIDKAEAAYKSLNDILNKGTKSAVEFGDASKFLGEDLLKQAEGIKNPDLKAAITSGRAAIVETQGPNKGKLAPQEMIDREFLRADKAAAIPDLQSLIDQTRVQRENQLYAQNLMQINQAENINPQTTAMGNVMEGFGTLGGPGGPSATSGTNFSDQSAGAQKKYNAELGITQKLYDDINKSTDEGIVAAQAFVNEFNPEQAMAFGDALGNVMEMGKNIANIKIGVETQNAALAADQFANSIYIAKRSLQDAKGLVGKAGGANNLGAIERQQFMLQRESQGLGLGLNQRQINFQRAQASFQAPGDTSEERAARKEQAKIEADYAQKQLDIQKKLFGLGKRSFDISGARQVRDLNKQVDLLERGRSVALDTIVANKKIEALSKAMTAENKRVETFYNTAVQRSTDVIGLTQQIANAAGKAMREVGSVMLTEIDKYFDGLIKAANDAAAGVTDSGYNRGNAKTRTQNAGGFAGTVSGTTSLGPVGVAGEAAGEAVAILKDPKKLISPMGGMGGGGDTYNETVIINNPVIRNDQDITALTVQVEKALNRRAALIGMRSLR